jgi:uncharacterized protein YecT (DUF1311 family)
VSLLLLFAAAASASGGCAGASTQAALNQCAAEAFTRADGALNRQWGETLATMKRRDAAGPLRGRGFGYASSLLASQRAWLAFRDAQCVIEGGEFAGGSAQGMAITRCKANLTAERTAQLKRLEWQQ